jgi:hypothetical protein
MGAHEPFEHLQDKLCQKERLRVKLASWLPSTRSLELTRPRCVQVECNTLLESSQCELQVFFRLHPNRRFEQGAMPSQRCESPNQDNFGTLPCESWDKKPFGCRCREEAHRILYGGRCGFPRIRVVVSFVSPKSHVACPSPKGGLESELTNLLIALMEVRVSK